MIRIFALVAALICVAPAIAQPLPANLDRQNAIVIDTTKGRIVFKLRTDLAPQHAEPLLDRKERRLAGMGANGEQQTIGQPHGLAHDIEVAIGDGVKRTGI